MASETRVAYFSMEIGLKTEMPTYSGGLGVLSGDTLRAAADLGVPVVAVTLLYRQGFFRQHLAADGHQSEDQPIWDPERFLEPCPQRVKLTIEGREVVLRPWLYRLKGVRGHEVPIYMLDADLPENAPEDAALTGQLYGGDQRYRLRQEAILGLGGVKMLRALGFDDIETYHMNEGHSALLTLALLYEEEPGRSSGWTDPARIAAVRRQCVFTTHTPVPAGHDRFPIGLVYEVLEDDMTETIHQLPCVEGHVLNMTYLGLFFSRFINGVAQLHGQVAQRLYPDYEIHAITNGVHARTWTSDAMAELFDQHLDGWRSDGHMLRRALTIPVEDVIDAHRHAKTALLDDEPAKDIIRRVYAAREALQGEIPVVYLEEHDMSLARLLCSGVDVWLNNPQRPMEASGTSGMKAALNGVPSLSVLDGWWPEGWVDGVTGWTIGDGVVDVDDPDIERGWLHNKLSYVIAPMFYGAPENFGRVMRSTIAINGAYFTAQRMLQQYIQEAYTVPKEGVPVPA